MRGDRINAVRASCSHCGKTKAAESFPRRGGNRLHSWCKSCYAAYARAYNRKHPHVRRGITDRHKKRTRALLKRVKKQPCTDCGGRFPHYVMDFDHVRGTKVSAISRMAYDRSRNAMMDEIVKCELVCANCHRVRTYRRAMRRMASKRAKERKG